MNTSLKLMAVVLFSIGNFACSTTAHKINETTESGLQIIDIALGSGAEAANGKKVQVHYVGVLKSGEKFDSSRDRNSPFTFTLGKREVIKGWEEGVQGMKVGGKRSLVIPPSLGYGERALSKIPANSTLVFEIELLKVFD